MEINCIYLNQHKTKPNSFGREMYKFEILYETANRAHFELIKS